MCRTTDLFYTLSNISGWSVKFVWILSIFNQTLFFSHYTGHHKCSLVLSSFHNKSTQIARFMGPTWGPPGDDRTQVGPMLAPWTLLSGQTNYWYWKKWFMATTCFCMTPTYCHFSYWIPQGYLSAWQMLIYYRTSRITINKQGWNAQVRQISWL